MLELVELAPKYDSAKSFGRKAFVKSKSNLVELWSYETLVAVFVDSEPVVYAEGVATATTLRHVKEFLKQGGFKAETRVQIIADYFEDKED